MNAIETHQLTLVFGRLCAVNSVSIEVPQGTVLGLLGANGAGKSTLLKLLAGHLRPTLAARLELQLDVKIGDLSRGHYVRVQIALALAHNPEVILLDEPTSGLDRAGRRELRALLVDEIGLRGRTVVLSSRLVEDIERMADSVAIMDSGRIVASGPLETLKSRGVAGATAATASLEEVFFDYVSRRSE